MMEGESIVRLARIGQIKRRKGEDSKTLRASGKKEKVKKKNALKCFRPYVKSMALRRVFPPSCLIYICGL